MTIYSKMRIANPTPYFEKPAQVLSDDNLCHDDKEKVLKSMALDADQILEATAEGMPWGNPGYDTKDLQSALVQLEDVKKADGFDGPNLHDASFKRVMVVTTVDQEMNRTIADKAYNMAEVSGGKVYLLSVIPPEFDGAGLAASGPMVTAIPRVMTDETQMIEDRSRQVEALRDEMESSVETEIAVRRGPIEQVIFDYADECDADLIVIGSPNQSWLEGLLDTSISNMVIRSALCPILVVPEVTEPTQKLETHLQPHTITGDYLMTDLARMAEVMASGARKETPLEKTTRIVRVINDDEAEARHAKTARLRKARFDKGR